MRSLALRGEKTCFRVLTSGKRSNSRLNPFDEAAEPLNSAFAPTARKPTARVVTVDRDIGATSTCNFRVRTREDHKPLRRQHENGPDVFGQSHSELPSSNSWNFLKFNLFKGPAPAGLFPFLEITSHYNIFNIFLHYDGDFLKIISIKWLGFF